MFVFLFILLLIALAFLLYDYLPDFLNWIGRIKIGSITDDEQWLEAVKNINRKWMTGGTPKLVKDENKKLQLVEKIRNINRISPTCYWQEAALLKAADEDDKSGAADLEERFIDLSTGEWIVNPVNIDAAMLAYEMMSNEGIDNNEIEPAMNYTAQMLKSLYEKYGSIPYNENAADIRFVDTVGMVCPFLIRYALTYKKEEYIEIAINQIAQYRKNGFDDDLKAPFHCFNESNKAKLGICGWGRGCAWWAIGVTDSLKELMKAEGYDREKALLLKLVMEISSVADDNINDDGSISRMLFTSSLADSSASAMFAYCFAWLYSLTGDSKYSEASEKIIRYLKSVTRRNGVIDFSQGDTRGIGFYSSSYSVIPAAQGFAASAVQILKNN